MKSKIFGIAVGVVLTLGSIGANAWQFSEFDDDFDEYSTKLIGWQSGEQWMSLGCNLKSDWAPIWFQVMEFGSFAFIGSDGSPKRLQVKAEGKPAANENNFRIRESDGSIVERSFFTHDHFKRSIDDLKNGVRYRVTSYDTSQYDIGPVPAIPAGLVKMILDECAG